MDLPLDSLVHWSVFFASSTLSWLMLLCNKSQSQGIWIHLLCSLSELFCVFWILVNPHEILESACQFLRSQLEFWWGFHWIYKSARRELPSFLSALRHMEVPGQESDPSCSCDLRHSCSNVGSSTPLSRAGDGTHVLVLQRCRRSAIALRHSRSSPWGFLSRSLVIERNLGNVWEGFSVIIFTYVQGQLSQPCRY